MPPLPAPRSGSRLPALRNSVRNIVELAGPGLLASSAALAFVPGLWESFKGALAGLGVPGGAAIAIAPLVAGAAIGAIRWAYAIFRPVRTRAQLPDDPAP